jgi:large subunit ribosomal protein L25
MGEKIVLTVEERKVLGKKVKQLRKQGFVPAVVYGHDFAAKSVMAPMNVAEKVWRDAGKHHVLELTIGDGAKKLAMIKSADLDPVKRRLRHLSLHVVKQNEKVETEVPVKIAGEGETEAEKAGLVILQTIEQITIQALPNDLPDFLEVDSSKLAAAEDHVTVADIKPVAGVAIMAEPEQIVATVYEPSALAAQNDLAAGTATDESEVEAENGAPAEGEESTAENGDEAAKKEEK